MTRQLIESISTAGRAKYSYSREHPARFLTRAAIAGFFIVVGALATMVSNGWLSPESAGAAKILSAVTFSAALILIVLLGGELFTGANLVMGVTAYDGQLKFTGVLRVWAMCYIGNFLGILLLCAIIYGSGASSAMLTESLSTCIPAKIAAEWYQLFLKGALCNFLVCIGVYSGFRLSSESGKIIVITLVITTFVLAGLEHSIANMAYFSLGAMLLPSPDWLGMLNNLLWVTLGNIFGGAVLVGLPLWWSAEPRTEK